MTREKAFKILNNWVEISKLSENCNKDEPFLYTEIGTITYGDIEEAIKTLEQEPCIDMEEIREVMSCDANAETKCKMISEIVNGKPHYFKEQEPKMIEHPQESEET